MARIPAYTTSPLSQPPRTCQMGMRPRLISRLFSYTSRINAIIVTPRAFYIKIFFLSMSTCHARKLSVKCTSRF